MTKVLSLALRVTGDASRLNLTPAERALQGLDAETRKVSSAFAAFATQSEAGARAQQQFADQAAALTRSLQAGLSTPQQFAEQFAALSQAAREEAAALERAAQITEQNLSTFERFTRTQAELTAQVDAGRISQDTYNRAIEAAARNLTDAERAAAGLAERNRDAEQAAQAAAEAEATRAAAVREAAAIAASVQTAEERREARLARLDELLASGALSEESYRRAVEQASGTQEAAARAEAERQRVLAEGQRITEQFATVEERRAAELANLDRLLESGAISQETFTRAAAQASGANEEAARAERARADALAAANRIIAANLTPQERYDQQIVELRGHLDAGRLSQEQFNRAAERARVDLDRTTTAARSTDRALQGISSQLRVISTIQIGRALIDGLRAFSTVVRSVSTRLDSLVDGVRQSLDEIDKLSLRTGINREALQGYGVAAELAGVSTQELGATFQRLAASIGRANPPAELTQGLSQLNLTVAQLRGLAPEEQFALIAQRISALPTATQRAGAAFGVLGEQGVRLTSLLQQQGNAIEELRQRSERLGIIVRDDQIANVTELNDTFTLVRRTIEGIIGQVSGNLAPLVTDIANDFLRFVENFTGFNATGGTAVADAITDSLLRGGEFLARVFDDTVEKFSGFSATLAEVSQVFSVTADVFGTVIDAAQAVYNLLQTAVSAITLGVGKVLEQIGRLPFLSDVGEFGSALADSAFEKFNENANEYVDAVDRAIASAGRVVFGDTADEAAARGEGAAEAYLREFRERVERERSPQFRVATNLEETQQKLEAFLADVGEGADDFFVQSQETVRLFRASAEAGQENASSLLIMNNFAETLNRRLEEETAIRQRAAEEARRQAEADAKRVEALTQASSAADKVAQDLAAVEREIARVQQQIAAAGAGEDGSAQARLDSLKDLQSQLSTQLDAAAQGFSQGFANAFASVQSRLNTLVDSASEFGDAGAEAAEQLRLGVEKAQQQAQAGILNREAFEQEVRRQEELFRTELDNVRQVADERKRVNELVDQRFLLARFGGDQQRLQAAQNLEQIEREISRVQADVQKARDAGNTEAARAGAARLAQLDQVKAQERDIASGRLKLEEEIIRSREEAFAFLEEQQRAAEQQQLKVIEVQQQAAEAEFDRQRNRIRELNTLGAGVVSGSDIRTSEGASLFLQLANQRQDPTLIEARLQTRRLGEIVNQIERLTGIPVVTFGALGVG